MAIQKISGVTIDLTRSGDVAQASGDVAYFDGTDWVRLAKGDPGDVLTMNETETAPEWGTPAWTFPGLIKGYYAAGRLDASNVTSAIDRWSFTTDGNSTDVGDVVIGRNHHSGQSSKTDGYISGSYEQGPVTLAIDRWSFSSEGNAVDHGDLAVQSGAGTGQSSETHGYHSGGLASSGGYRNNIQKFLFATSGTNNATDIADLLVARAVYAGSSSTTHGYSAGGNTGGVNFNTTIDKFPFATDSNATDVGDCDTSTSGSAGTSSLTHGYISGGSAGPVTSNIRKYSFASDGNSVDGGADLSAGRSAVTGCSSETFGYVAGGNAGANVNIIEKYSVSTDSNATDVGDLVVVKQASTPVGSQV